VVHLDLLTREQVRDILAHDASVINPDVFLKNAEDRGLDALLHNPQTLNLLIEAVQGSEWPRTRQETFRLACEKLAAELNAEHRTATKSSSSSTSAVLHAAGGLCAIQLLADISAFTETGQARSGVVSLRDISCLSSLALPQALKTRLFTGIGEEEFAPVHRNVAEYLGAQFLSNAIEVGHVTVGRVLALMTAADGRTVAGLRGLHAWLAVHHPESRRRLIEIDPLGVILYGDVKLFSADDKVDLLQTLHRLAAQYSAFRWQDWSAKPFGALATADVVEHFKSILASPCRDEAYQALVDCVLDAVRYGDPLPQLKADLRAVVLDATRTGVVRGDALAAYIHVSPSDTTGLQQIAEDIRDGKIEDPDDEMLGRLLYELFPRAITPQNVFSYLHKPKNDHLIGMYHMFWSHKIGETISGNDLPALLDALVENKSDFFDDRAGLVARNMIGTLLRRAVTEHGDYVTGERLYDWLGTSVDKYGSPRLDRDDSSAIKDWIDSRAARYPEFMAVCISRCTGVENFHWCVSRGLRRLFGARPPDDIAQTWLRYAQAEQDQQKADYLFQEAVGHLFRDPSCAGLSLEFFENWVKERPRFENAYQKCIYNEVPDWQREHADCERKNKQEKQKQHDERMQFYRRHLPAIRAGDAPVQVLHDLALAYMGRLIEAEGESGIERLQSFLDGDAELVASALHAFRASVERVDLPTVQQILDLDAKGRQYLIREACLVGMDERYSADPSQVLDLHDEVLGKALAFHYTYLGNDAAWFSAAVQRRPELVARILIQYTLMRLDARKNHVSGTYSLVHDDNYAAVAREAVEPLLRAFPIRVKKKVVCDVLDNLLKAALKYMRDIELEALIDGKLELENMDAAQRVHWLAAGFVVNSAKYEAPLSVYVGKSRPRTLVLAGFFSDRHDRWIIRDAMQESSLSYLIRMFAPGCLPDRPSGAHWVSPAMHTADFVRALINRLGGTPTDAAQKALQNLLGDPSLSTWHRALRHALQTQQVSQREATFRHPTVREVCDTLENRSPANAADLSALTVEHLRDLANQIRHGSTDQYKQFWNVDQYARPTIPRPEDACRDSLLERLNDKLRRFGVQAVPEGHYANDKRADIRVSYATPTTSIAVPVEIKRDSHRDLWKAITDQLIDLYTREPEAKGRGIFVAFWFGGKNMPAPPQGDKPGTASHLEAQLISLIPLKKRELISVCVIDCSVPEDK
jgi:hypothetical protein